MARSRWNWLILPLSFAATYEAMNWTYWVPQWERAWIIAHNGDGSFIPYWQGEVIASDAIQLFCVVLLSGICCGFALRAKLWEVILIGGLMGLATCVLDRLWENWVEYHFGYLAGLFGIPIVVGGVLILLLRLHHYIWRRGSAYA